MEVRGVLGLNPLAEGANGVIMKIATLGEGWVCFIETRDTLCFLERKIVKQYIDYIQYIEYSI